MDEQANAQPLCHADAQRIKEALCAAASRVPLELTVSGPAKGIAELADALVEAFARVSRASSPSGRS